MDNIVDKKKPERKCIVCQKRFEKSELIRIVKNKADEIRVDETGKEDGRGAYICFSCVPIFLKDTKKNPLARSFKKNISKDIIDQISEVVTRIEKIEK